MMWSALARLVEQTEPALLDAWRSAQEYANRLAALRIAAPRRSADG